jgi:hypothetical protein
MAIKNQALTVLYTAWDTSANAGKTGDVANHTLKIIKDGTTNTPTNSPSEVDATNCPGVYKLVLTAGEMNADSITLAGKSGTASISIIPTHITTERGIIGTNLDAQVSLIPTNPLPTNDSRLNNLDAQISLRPTLSTIEGSTVLAKQALLTALHNIVNIKQATINDTSPTSTKFNTTLTETTNGYWSRSAIEFTSGNNIGVIRQIKNYTGSSKEVQLVTPLPNSPVNGDAFSIVMLRNFIVDPTGLNTAVWGDTRSSYTTPGTFGNDLALQSDLLTAKGNTTTLLSDTTTLKGNATTLLSDTTTLKGDTTTLKGDTTTLKGDTLAILIDTDEAQQKLPTQYIMGSATKDSQDLKLGEIKSVVESIQNVTTFAGIVPTELNVPSAGSTIYKLYGRLFDTNGSPNDPDNNIITIMIKDFSGNNVVAQTNMTRTGVGAYEYSYAVPSTEETRAIVVFFGYTETSISVEHPRVTRLIKGGAAGVFLGGDTVWVKPITPSPVPSEN